jgi:hypothetical protein
MARLLRANSLCSPKTLVVCAAELFSSRGGGLEAGAAAGSEKLGRPAFTGEQSVAQRYSVRYRRSYDEAMELDGGMRRATHLVGGWNSLPSSYCSMVRRSR